jgi:hypothetical protein
MAQKQSFTAEHCQRITWAILDDGRAHFDDIKTMLDFRGPDKPVWPQSYLIDILENVRYALPVECANFPEEWKRKIRVAGPEQGGQMGGNLASPPKGRDHMLPSGSNTNATLQRKHGQHQGYGAGGGHSVVQGNTGQWWPNHFHGQYQGAGYPGGAFPVGGMQQPRDWQSGWKDERHPKIKAVMQGYLAQTNGRVHFAKILAATGRRQIDLPTLPKYVHALGRPFLCWTSVLSRCTYRDCHFHREGGHPLPADITDDFAEVIDIFGKGLLKPITNMGSGSPPKKQKVGDAATQN